jgi:hypothetical protein
MRAGIRLCSLFLDTRKVLARWPLLGTRASPPRRISMLIGWKGWAGRWRATQKVNEMRASKMWPGELGALQRQTCGCNFGWSPTTPGARSSVHSTARIAIKNIPRI